MPLPRTTAEQRASLYDDVSSLLSPGFLTASVRVHDSVFHLRSLCPSDLFMLRHRVDQGGDDVWRLWTVASSIWMVNGVSFLGKDDVVPVLAGLFQNKVRARILDILFHQVLGLFARVDRAVEATPIFCHEITSRYRWRTTQGGRTLSMGAPGASSLGPNVVQGLWAAYNEAEDHRHQEMVQWEGFKFMTSPHAPKAVQKIDAADKSRAREEEASREAALDRFFYYRTGVLSREMYEKDLDSADAAVRVAGPKTVGTLEDEMRRWVSGEQDHHDLVVANYKRSIMEKHRQEALERERRRLALQVERERYAEAQVDEGPQKLVGFTQEQLRDVLTGRQPGVRRVHEGPPKGQADYIHDKWLSAQEDKGILRVEGGRIVADGANPEEDVKRLDDILRQRQVPFHGGAEET
jgi:hypothetical protein